MVDELLADAKFKKYNKRKYVQIIQELNPNRSKCGRAMSSSSVKSSVADPFHFDRAVYVTGVGDELQTYLARVVEYGL